MISRVDFIQTLGTISPLNTSGFWGTINPNHDTNSEIQIKLNELVDAVNLLQTGQRPHQEQSQNTDAKFWFEIIKENNAMWMKLLEFMRDTKLDIPKEPQK